jgi:methylmalonyl-CoA epimerase
MTSLEHVGVAVEDPDAVAATYEKLLGIARYKRETVSEQDVRTHFLDAGSAKLELLEALDAESAVARFLDRNGEGLHHLAFEVPDLDVAHERARLNGFEPLGPPRPGADGKRVFFLHPKQTHGVLVEFCRQTGALGEPEYVSLPSGRVAVYERGSPERPAVVLLHGLGGSTELETAPLLHRLKPRFRVLALDLPGHGASGDFAGETLSLDLLAESLVAALDHAGLERAHLFGFSLGGAVVLRAALRHPERVRRLAAHATHVAWTDERARDLQARLRPERFDENAQERLAGAHGTEWRERFGRYRRFAGRLPKAKSFDVQRLRAPVLVSAFDRDPLVDLNLTLRLHRPLPDARMAVLPGARHAARALPLDAYAPLLANWLDAA